MKKSSIPPWWSVLQKLSSIYFRCVELYKEVGRLIANYRKEKGISQEKLAALSDLHEDYIGKIERGERKATLETILKLLNVLKINYSEFFARLKYP